jgi:hypothetical protein
MKRSGPGAHHVRPVARSGQRTADEGLDPGLSPDEEDPGGDRVSARREGIPLELTSDHFRFARFPRSRL